MGPEWAPAALQIALGGGPGPPPKSSDAPIRGGPWAVLVVDLVPPKRSRSTIFALFLKMFDFPWKFLDAPKS